MPHTAFGKTGVLIATAVKSSMVHALAFIGIHAALYIYIYVL
jgi:hypothetical protein